MTEAIGLNAADVALIVGIGQCLMIWLGIRAMKDSSDSRRESDTAERRAYAAERRQDIQMLLVGLQEQSAGIRELLERTSERKP